MNIEEEVLNRFNEICKGRGITVTKDSNLKEMGLDSLDVVEMLTDMEEAHNIEFDNEEMLSLNTVNDVICVIEKKIKK